MLSAGQRTVPVRVLLQQPKLQLIALTNTPSLIVMTSLPHLFLQCNLCTCLQGYGYSLFTCTQQYTPEVKIGSTFECKYKGVVQLRMLQWSSLSYVLVLGGPSYRVCWNMQGVKVTSTLDVLLKGCPLKGISTPAVFWKLKGCSLLHAGCEPGGGTGRSEN
jgi:hypothetical protein